MWTLQPALARTVSLLQIATPSRGAIEAYGNLQSELAKLVSDVNGRHGEVDWTPIRYLNKGFSQTVLAGLYRTAQVGVVTPLHDGMNLVAKEYVAAQNPADPGVLVLSKFAGAANELDTALLVNPHDIDGMARTIATRALDAADRAADALGSDDGETSRRHDPAMVCRFRRCAAGDPSSTRLRRAADGRAAGLMAAALGQFRRAVSLAPSLIAIRCAVEHGDSASCSGALGLSSGTTPLPWPTNTPCPTITDDLLPMMTLGCGDEARSRAVGPDDRIAGQQAAPAVIAAHVGALAGAGLRQRRSGASRCDRGHQNRECQRPFDGHVASVDRVAAISQSSSRDRFSVQRHLQRRRPRAGENAKLSRLFNRLWKYSRSRPRSLAKVLLPLQDRASGEMAEWLKAHAWKACVRETVPWVRIPLSPPPSLGPCNVRRGTGRKSLSKVNHSDGSGCTGDSQVAAFRARRRHFSPELRTSSFWDSSEK